MKRLLLAPMLASATAHAAGDAPPPWMPAPPPSVAGGQQRGREARKLRREGAIYTGVGVALFVLITRRGAARCAGRRPCASRAPARSAP